MSTIQLVSALNTYQVQYVYRNDDNEEVGGSIQRKASTPEDARKGALNQLKRQNSHRRNLRVTRVVRKA